MPEATPDWPQIALYALGGALVLMLLFRLPVVGRLLRFAVLLALVAFLLFILVQQAPYQPQLARVAERFGLDPQVVSGREVRIAMAADGHFWASATLNGVKRRMLIDSGATVTAISESTAAAAGVQGGPRPVPVVLRTANGMAPARTGSVGEMRLGNIVARDLRVVVSPAFGDLDVIGMNFLSKLASWRVEGRTLVLVPHRPQPERG
ncbi:MAG TPA: TIGR02281 family clan AA aspartic protease [Allosphingosinicella sp.]|jgi:aspartyl protease family protein|nr:TIGR02281 family clan AA aspartic protease [Allosphingosinicella sp.]